VIVMGTNRDVAIAQLRIAAAQNTDNVVRRCLGRTIDERGVSGGIDLQRERAFQGAGLLDLMKVLQAV